MVSACCSIICTLYTEACIQVLQLSRIYFFIAHCYPSRPSKAQRGMSARRVNAGGDYARVLQLRCQECLSPRLYPSKERDCRRTTMQTALRCHADLQRHHLGHIAMGTSHRRPILSHLARQDAFGCRASSSSPNFIPPDESTGGVVERK